MNSTRHAQIPNFMASIAKHLVMSLLLMASLTANTEGSVDHIVAVVEDEVILDSELKRKIESIKEGLVRSGTPLPTSQVLARQVLDRLILEKIQISLAHKSGITTDDETLRQAVIQIAERNRISPEELRNSLRQEGIEYADFLDQIRNELTIQRLRSSQVNSQVKVSDREIEHWLESRGKPDSNPNAEYLLGHILVSTPQAASPAIVQQARDKAEKLLNDIKKGLDFQQAALGSSDSAQALSGGDLGWRKLAGIPSLFADMVPQMKKGDVAGPIHSPSGFHLIKLLDWRSGAIDHITKTHVRHILIKPSELLSNEDAKKKVEAIKLRVQGGDDFGDLARGNSDDKGSAVKGGDLGFVTPGVLVPEFESTMNDLDINQLSEPVQSQFGWHLIQVLERQESDDTKELLRKQAQEDIFKRKAEEETELWLRRIRDEAYIDIRDPEFAPEGAGKMPKSK